MRLGHGLRGLLVLVLALRLHHHFRGPPVDYGALALGSAASWIGVPGPGEPLLIAAGVFAGRHKLDVASVLVVAWAGATAGGTAGWLIGFRAGRALVTAPGPLLRLRTAAVARGDEVFTRFTVVAILLTPSWIAGIHRVRPAIYLPTNAVAAALWACGIGLGSYFLGPPIVELVGDLGWITGVALGLLVALAVTTGMLRRRRRRRLRPAEASEPGD